MTTPGCWRCGNTDQTELVKEVVQTEDMPKPAERLQCKHTFRLACISARHEADQKRVTL